MTNFHWDSSEATRQLYLCRSDARSWDELRPALVACWIRFAEVLGTMVPQDLRGEITLNFFASSGRVVFDHKKRAASGDWTKIPTDYLWTVICKSEWVEEQWESVSNDDERIETILGQLGTTLARICLECGSEQSVSAAFASADIQEVVIRGQGVTQSPSQFMLSLAELKAGQLPAIQP